MALPFGVPFPQAPMQISMPAAQITIPQSLRPLPNPPLEQVAPLAAQAGRSISLVQVAALLWLIGFLLFLLHQFVGYRLFKKQALRWSRPISNGQITRQLKWLSLGMGVERPIVPLVSDKVSGPLMTGFVKPLLFLPHED